MDKKIICTHEEDIRISCKSDLVTEIRFNQTSVMLDHDTVYDLAYRLVSYLAYLESLPEEGPNSFRH
jgi:hypothetical protein